MGARPLLLVSLLLLLLLWTAYGGWLQRASNTVRLIVGILFVICAVRLGISIAIILFDMAPASWAIPAALGIGAWLVRPGRGPRREP